MPMCQGKKKYGTEAFAQSTADELAAKRRVRLYVYKCKACGCYHHSRSPMQIVSST